MRVWVCFAIVCLALGILMGLLWGKMYGLIQCKTEYITKTVYESVPRDCSGAIEAEMSKLRSILNNVCEKQKSFIDIQANCSGAIEAEMSKLRSILNNVCEKEKSFIDIQAR